MRLNVILKMALVISAITFGWGSYGVAGDWVSSGANIYYKGGNVGIGTMNPKHDLDVAPSIRFGYFLWGVEEISVNSSTPVLLTHTDGTPIADNYQYRVKLVTRETNTATGAEYLIWYDRGATVWKTRYVSRDSINSNHPQIVIESGVPKIKTSHATLYPVRVFKEALQTGESDALPSLWGNSYHWQRHGNVLSYEDGSVAIGTDNAGTYMLNVAGKVRADEVIVNTTGADYVFEEGYSLKPLQEVESFIKKEKHLPNIPSSTEMQTQGVGISEMQIRLLLKVEELTLYLIEIKKENDKKTLEIQDLQKRLAELEKQM